MSCDAAMNPPLHFEFCFRFTLASLLLIFFVAPASAGLPETVARLKPSLVAVGTVQKSRTPVFRAIGTGFAVGDGSVIATNSHVAPVVTDPGEPELLAVLVRGAGGEFLARAAHKIAADPEHDLALLKIDGPALKAVQLSDASVLAVREGQSVAFSGFPIINVLGHYPATNRAIISAISPIAIPSAFASQLGGAQIKRLARGSFDIYQIDANSYPGNSGSPLFDADTGEVIGIINMALVTATKEAALSQPSGITYAIPVRYLLDLLQAVR